MQTAKQTQIDEKALAGDIRAFERIQAKLEREHMDKYALVFEEKFIDAFPDFNAAVQYAIAHFGKGPYLIRRIGRSTIDTDTALHLR
jgi:hypothetical protein